MYESYDDEDNAYDDDYDKYDYPKDNYKWYYKFDIGPNTPISDWINDIVSNFMGSFDDKIDKYWGSINSISGFPFKKFPVNSYVPNTAEGQTSLYLGNNYYNESVWKHKTFIQENLHKQYVLHLQSNVDYFLRQPRYYKGLHEILN